MGRNTKDEKDKVKQTYVYLTFRQADKVNKKLGTETIDEAFKKMVKELGIDINT